MWRWNMNSATKLSQSAKEKHNISIRLYWMKSSVYPCYASVIKLSYSGGGESYQHIRTQCNFFMAQQPVVGQEVLIVVASRLHSDTPHSVGLLWTSDRPIAETYDNTQHSQVTDVHSPGGIWTRDRSKRAVADTSHRLRGDWDQHAL
jgi:hypothetical protein